MAVETHVAFLGPAGTFTHEAAQAIRPRRRYDACSTIDAVFDAVRRKDAPAGVVPIENSTEGSVTQALDCLLDGDVVIAGEMVLDITHCLASHAAALSEVERVYSHPQALAQCRRWLAESVGQARLVDSPSTAAAVRHAAADHRGAAIGSRFAPLCTAYRYCGRDSGRRTQRDAFRAPGARTTRRVPATTRRRSRSLFTTSAAHCARARDLRRNGINLSRIETRPSRQRAWDYVFAPTSRDTGRMRTSPAP